MAKTRKRKSTKATAKAKVVRTKAAKKTRKTKAPGRDEKGPLGWLIPDLESAYARLTPRGAEGGFGERRSVPIRRWRHLVAGFDGRLRHRSDEFRQRQCSMWGHCN